MCNRAALAGDQQMMIRSHLDEEECHTQVRVPQVQQAAPIRYEAQVTARRGCCDERPHYTECADEPACRGSS